jgi:DNA-binding GntR family transcriptional regulator
VAVPDYSDPTPARSQIAADLRDQIRAGTYAPESRLPSNVALAKRYGVAPETIRSALDELRAEKIVETRSTRGTYVTSVPTADRVHLDLATAGERLADLTTRVEEYDDLRARVEVLESRLGRIEADVLYLYDRDGIEYDHGGGRHDDAEKAAGRRRSRR